MQIFAFEVILKHWHMHRNRQVASCGDYRIEYLACAVFEREFPERRFGLWVEQRAHICDFGFVADQFGDIKVLGVFDQILMHILVIRKKLDIWTKIQVVKACYVPGGVNM